VVTTKLNKNKNKTVLQMLCFGGR